MNVPAEPRYKKLPFALAAAAPLEPLQVAFEPPAAQPHVYIVRVGVFHDLDNANTAYQQMQVYGHARIVIAVGANGPLYRVELGPVESKADADAAMTAAIGEGFEDAKLITSEPLQISMK